MSYGVKTYSDDGYINLHSDYSALVYAGEFGKTTDPVRPVYQGSYAISINDYLKDSKYDQGWLIQYQFLMETSYLVPFYRPTFNGQEVGIIDVVNEGSKWIVNVLFSGAASKFPRLFGFVPLTEKPGVTLAGNGVAVYDANEQLVFTGSERPLRIDDVLTVQHPTAIKTGGRGTCGRNGSACHINYTPDQSTTHTGVTTNTNSKIYHVVPSAYGGLAFSAEGTYNSSCGFLGLGTRKYAWGYRSWSSFRGTLTHPYGAVTHTTGWLGDFSGAMYQQVRGSCGVGGFLGALLGIVVAVFTGGVGLALLGGALAGFAVGSMVSATSPALKAYENDENFEKNSAYELLITDAQYYGIPSANGLDDGADYTAQVYEYSTSPLTFWEIQAVEIADSTVESSTTIYWNGVEVSAGTTVGEFVSSFTAANGDTYVKGDLEYHNTVADADSETITDRFRVARIGVGEEPAATSDVPANVTEVYAGVAAWKAGDFSPSTWWAVYGQTVPLSPSNTTVFIWYNGQLVYFDWLSGSSSIDTTSVTGSDGRTYYRGDGHPEDGNPYGNYGYYYLFYGVGRS